ncbi:MAG TPA: excinuclease ABC subunit C [Gammaproteobacteria bacterium]|jgi:excinuclease ABC subunit C|nr:excinuclease ABC subunit UvrC [Arenicellales bacterium]MDP6791766.1 excinuclease ABC subunit UvrC [Arenicellales bacterium]MDP6918581.1 excinuclease ABC subunit UvrC [Arenicellales bacterium]HCX87200.1 excinuclease ABC subunit C [Gammaproteobacteria bacterium]|tara:strand:+ start:33459 stop:35270 length:1812 start_codon:yes stop_codon:yes gene_type:complete
MPLDKNKIVKGLSRGPGVYVMRNEHGSVLYVGKARNLKARLSSYFNAPEENSRLRLMMSQVEGIEIQRTRTETEALLLECNLIKDLRPKFNILLRDDKSYPYLKLSTTERFPRLSFYRGSTKVEDRLFGPYANAGSVRIMLAQLQKIIPIRQCDNNTFRNRSRPCLQYQIGRCSAPCVGLISEDEYREDVRELVLLLEGKESEINGTFARKMDEAAANLDYESAARYRDRILALRKLQERQYVSSGQHNADVVLLTEQDGAVVFSVMKIRGGHNLGSRHFSHKNPLDRQAGEVLQKLLVQHYQNHPVPAEVIVMPAAPEPGLLEAALSDIAGKRVRVKFRVRGVRAQWLEMANLNATDHLKRKLASDANHLQRLEALKKLLGRTERLERIECFDTSHSAGEHPVASCVVFDASGPVSGEYRRFNIKDVTPGDDFAAMEQVVGRRIARVNEGEGIRPDLMVIDGGPGQVKRAQNALEENLATDVAVIGVAKGYGRRSGRESLYLPGRKTPLLLDPSSPAHLLLRQIRDEAHRFAITGHRKKRNASRTRSKVEDIPGIGAKKRQALLRHFGGIKPLQQATIEDLVKVDGISVNLAQRLRDHFRAG